MARMNWRRQQLDNKGDRFGRVDVREEHERLRLDRSATNYLRRVEAAGSQYGVPCPRCGRATQIRAHDKITEKLLRQPYYYRRWFYCANQNCRTTLIMREEDRVYPKEPAAPEPTPSKDVVLEVLDEISDDDLPW